MLHVPDTIVTMDMLTDMCCQTELSKTQKSLKAADKQESKAKGDEQTCLAMRPNGVEEGLKEEGRSQAERGCEQRPEKYHYQAFGVLPCQMKEAFEWLKIWCFWFKSIGRN